jgi:hypothetical protein
LASNTNHSFHHTAATTTQIICFVIRRQRENGPDIAEEHTHRHRDNGQKKVEITHRHRDNGPAFSGEGVKKLKILYVKKRSPFN